MKMTLSAALLAAAMLAAPAFAQDMNPPPGSAGLPPAAPLDPLESLTPGADTPQPLTGELVPLPTAPPEGEAARIKLPDCAPPNCGVPQIMAQ